jgi:nudix motif 8
MSLRSITLSKRFISIISVRNFHFNFLKRELGLRHLVPRKPQCANHPPILMLIHDDVVAKPHSFVYNYHTINILITQTTRFLSSSSSQILQDNTTATGLPSLRQVFSHLQHRFDHMTNDDGHFPISIMNPNTKRKYKIPSSLFREHNTENNISGSPKNDNNNKTRTDSREQLTTTDRAAVLIMLCMVQNQPSILFTRRSSELSTHAAQISFPGGKYDPVYDTNDIDTAFREAYEELMPRSVTSYDQFRRSSATHHEQFTIIGTATPVPSLRGKPVVAVLCIYWPEFIQASDLNTEFPGNPEEVDTVFTVPIHDLLQNESTYPIPSHEQKQNNHTKQNDRFGLTHTPSYPSNYGPIWGLTAFILQPFLRDLFEPIFLNDRIEK